MVPLDACHAPTTTATANNATMVPRRRVGNIGLTTPVDGGEGHHVTSERQLVVALQCCWC
jgi:hypothetical protein